MSHGHDQGGGGFGFDDARHAWDGDQNVA